MVIQLLKVLFYLRVVLWRSSYWKSYRFIEESCYGDPVTESLVLLKSSVMVIQLLKVFEFLLYKLINLISQTRLLKVVYMVRVSVGFRG